MLIFKFHLIYRRELNHEMGSSHLYETKEQTEHAEGNCVVIFCLCFDK